MAVVAAGVGVGDQGRLQVVRIARRQIQDRREGLIDVTGGTQPAADDVEMPRPARPVLARDMMESGWK